MEKQSFMFKWVARFSVVALLCIAFVSNEGIGVENAFASETIKFQGFVTDLIGSSMGDGLTTVKFEGPNDGGGTEIIPHQDTKNHSTIGGGFRNTASGATATVAGGMSNTASGYQSTIGGGASNTASGNSAALCGGLNNNASGVSAVIGGGSYNTASGQYATVPGGRLNTAKGDLAFASGRQAQANHQGSFVWGDSTDADITSFGNDTFTIRASGGVKFFSNSGATAGVSIATGGASWSSISDRNLKANFVPVDGRKILSRLKDIPISTWNLKSQDPSVRHIGPTAQDFFAAFNVGEDDRHITTLDLDGVALAAIQGLDQIVQEKEEQIVKLETRLSVLEQAVAESSSQTGSFPKELSPSLFLFGGLILAGFTYGRRVSERIQKS